ncbi:hypothetical protein F5Y16DRAFT_386720 [Xylariaceae sp. FL0255]|nr:hypothetical protein F5Y16DRAFT_386720 [Xylariaceae sp. FL0255]
MAMPRIHAMRALAWGATGINVIIFAKWHLNDLPASVPGDPRTLQRRMAVAKHRQYMYDNYTLSKRNIDEGRWKTMITSAFSHRDVGHLLVNMFMLHQATQIATFVGMGPLRWSMLALGSAVGGSLGSLYDSAEMAKLGERDAPGLGASGMVQGMLVATVRAAPYLPMHVFFIPVAISYRTVVLGFIAYDMYNLAQQRAAGQRKKSWMTGSFVGYAAHLGGAAFGFLFYSLAFRRGRMPPFGRR